ncbi:MAG: VapE domain-containing protein [Xenococcaceae cyanobacterium]
MSELKTNSNNSIIAQNVSTTYINDDERQENPKLTLKYTCNNQRELIDSHGNSFPVASNEEITSKLDIKNETKDINEQFNSTFTLKEVAELLEVNYEKLPLSGKNSGKKKSNANYDLDEKQESAYRKERAIEIATNGLDEPPLDPERLDNELLLLKSRHNTPRLGEVPIGYCPVTQHRFFAPEEDTVTALVGGKTVHYRKDDVYITKDDQGGDVVNDKFYSCSFNYVEDLVEHFLKLQLNGEFEDGGVEYSRWCLHKNFLPWRLKRRPVTPEQLEKLKECYTIDRNKYSCSATRQQKYLNPDPKPFDEETWRELGCGDKNKLTLVFLKGGTGLKDENSLELVKPIKQNVFTGNIEFYGEPMEVSIAEIEHFQNKFNVKNREFKAVVTNEALKNRYNPAQEFFTYLYLGFLGESGLNYIKDSTKDTSTLMKIYDSAIAAYQHSSKKVSNIKYHEIFPEVSRSVISLEEYISKGFHLTDKWYIDAIKKSMISAVARTFEPGCKVDETLILKGEQGVRKSTATEVVGFRELGFQTKKMDNEVKGKEAVMNFQGGFIHEIDEIDRITCTRLASETKSFFTSSIDSYVPKYANNSINVPRHWIVIGTTNEQDLFLDHENRRYNVVEINQEINIDYLREHREIAWALAIDAYFKGEKWWYDSDEEGSKVRRERNRDYMFSDSRTSDVLEKLTQHELVDANMVARVLEGLDPISIPIPSKKSIYEARDILKKSGWLKASGKKTMPYGSRSKAAYINPDFKTPEQRTQERLDSYNLE